MRRGSEGAPGSEARGAPGHSEEGAGESGWRERALRQPQAGELARSRLREMGASEGRWEASLAALDREAGLLEQARAGAARLGGKLWAVWAAGLRGGAVRFAGMLLDEGGRMFDPMAEEWPEAEGGGEQPGFHFFLGAIGSEARGEVEELCEGMRELARARREAERIGGAAGPGRGRARAAGL